MKQEPGAGAVHSLMDQLIGQRDYSLSQWEGQRFEILKKASATDKGNLGEDLLQALLGMMGYADVSMESRRGHWDVRVQNGNQEVKFEVKVASQDVHGSHQFNGIRYDTKYTHLFLLGATPSELRYRIIDKRDIEDHKMVPMAKGSNAAFKLTFKTADLHSFDSFAKEIKHLLGTPADDRELQ